MRWIEGPTLPVLRTIGLRTSRVYIATAFYSDKALRWLEGELGAKEVVIAARLDLASPREWFRGSINPESLLRLLSVLGDRGTSVSLFSSPTAHAKMYVGPNGVIVGSSNLSMRGFGAGPEIVSVCGVKQVNPARRTIKDYLRHLQQTPLADLEAYVAKYAAAARKARQFRLGHGGLDEDHLSPIRVQGPGRPAGDYLSFLAWLARQRSGSAREILARAKGKGQLSGHIYRNFYGLRQFLLTNPDQMDRFAVEDPDTYRLSTDGPTEQLLAEFVQQNAVDEPKFVLNIWKTYLPVECGGRAGKHGGTIGNLNRMLPLVARYLRARGYVSP